MMECRKFIVTGKVQGVFFRAHTKKQAKQLRLTGHALNLPDGSVEVIACGEPASLDALAQWLTQGSPRARVDDVSAESIDLQPFEKFTTG